MNYVFFMPKQNKLIIIIIMNMMLRCLNMSEFTIIDRVLNMSNTMHSARSLYKLMNTY